MLKAKNALLAKAFTCGKEAHLLPFLGPQAQVGTILMHAETCGDSFVSPYLMTTVLLSFIGPPVFCVVKDHERA